MVPTSEVTTLKPFSIEGYMVVIDTGVRGSTKGSRRCSPFM